MKQSNRLTIVGWVLLLVAIGCLCFQIGYLFLHHIYHVELIDNRLFYIVNILCVLCLTLAFQFLLHLSKMWKIIGVVIVSLFITVNAALLISDNDKIKNITSISPNYKNILSIKMTKNVGLAMYYRSYYGIFARPKEILPKQMTDEFKVAWLANDVAAVTYTAPDQSIHQYIGTYGDRGGGTSYYYVGAEIHGTWIGNQIQVISHTDGITIIDNGNTDSFDWDHINQYGTLAVVLTNPDGSAAWTIALNENFHVDQANQPIQKGQISLYKATMADNEPITLDFKNDD
ncbi:hypothetical protein ACFFIS_05170 [Virgibacillus soli]